MPCTDDIFVLNVFLDYSTYIRSCFEGEEINEYIPSQEVIKFINSLGLWLSSLLLQTPLHDDSFI